MLVRSVKMNLFAAAEKLHKCICFPSLLGKTEPFIFCYMKRHHIMIILVDHFPSILGCPFFLSLYCSPDKIFLKCYICLWTASWQKEGKTHDFLFNKIFLRYVLKRNRKWIPGPSKWCDCINLDRIFHQCLIAFYF